MNVYERFSSEECRSGEADAVNDDPKVSKSVFSMKFIPVTHVDRQLQLLFLASSCGATTVMAVIDNWR